MSELARLDVHQRDGVLVAVLTGELDLSNAAGIEERITGAADVEVPLAPPGGRVVFTLRLCGFRTELLAPDLDSGVADLSG
jgi:hypothetical protein